MARERTDFNKMNDDEIRRLRDQVLKEEKERRKEVIDRAIRVVGLLASVYIYILIFSSTTALTLFGYLYSGRPGYQTPEELWTMVLQTADIYKFFMGGPYPGLAITLLTIVQLGLGITLGVLIATYIRDMVRFIRSFFGIGKNIISNAVEGAKEGVEGIVPSKKSLFNEDSSNQVEETKVKETLQEKRNRKELEKLKRQAEKENIVLDVSGTTILAKPVVDPVDEELNKALTDPNYKPAVQPSTTVEKKSLFDKK
jgi:hypothetical protein